MSFYTVNRRVAALVVSVALDLALSFHQDNSSSSNNNVMMLTTKNFDVTVDETRHLFVQFCEYSTFNFIRACVLSFLNLLILAW